MNLSRQLLLGLAVLTLQLERARAADLLPPPADHLPTMPAPSAPLAPAPTAEASLFPTASCDCEDERSGGFIGGVGLYLLQPHFENNPAYLTIQNTGGNPPAQTEKHVDVSHHMQAAPLLWLGYVNDEGFGGRARYWHFREGTNQTLDFPTGGNVPGGGGFRAVSAVPLGLILFPNLGQVSALNVTTKLELNVGDVEAMQNVQAGRWEMLLSGGIRFARIDQTYNAYTAATPGGQVLGPLLSSHRFTGAGPVLALEAHRPIGESGLGFYGNARGAFLYGSAQQNASIVRQNDVGADHRNRGLPVGELEMGLEFGRNMNQGRLIGQVGLVGQDWFGAGSASRSAIQRNPGGQPLGGVAIDSDFAFIGLAIRLGVAY